MNSQLPEPTPGTAATSSNLGEPSTLFETLASPETVIDTTEPDAVVGFKRSALKIPLENEKSTKLHDAVSTVTPSRSEVVMLTNSFPLGLGPSYHC